MLYLLGTVFLQIVLESLPISSSGNCALWTHLLELYTNIKACSMPVDIDFLMHGPTIVVVGVYFFDVISWYLLHIRQTYKSLWSLAMVCLIVGHITALGYLVFRLFSLITIPLYVGFSITAAFLFSLLCCKKVPTKKVLTYRDGVILGIVQALSLLPGISRFASTYVAARWLGFYNYHAFGYSFLIQMPLLGVAFLKGLYGVYSGEVSGAIFTPSILIVALCAMVVSYFALQLVGRLINKDKVYVLGWYVIGTAFIAYIYGI